ncbi:carbonic anhydrase [Striga asiatica]|uniref:Carbonic anhydrase n=1 Tax=Striga asiatica TaxID=4170 RepID=A0A5A7PRD4_STRAF|nr:carbonic anhydrase [Striga asiatica]
MAKKNQLKNEYLWLASVWSASSNWSAPKEETHGLMPPVPTAMRARESINAGEGDNCLKAAQIGVGHESPKQGEYVGGAHPISDVRGRLRQRLVHLSDQVSHHVHRNREKRKPLRHLIH